MQKSQPLQQAQDNDHNLRKQLKSPTYSQGSCNRKRKISRASVYTNSKKKLSEIHENLVELQQKFAHFQSTLKEINLNNIETLEEQVPDTKIIDQKVYEKTRKTQRPRVQKIVQSCDGKEKKNKKQKIRIDNKIYQCKNIPSSYFQNLQILFQKQNKRSKTALRKRPNQNKAKNKNKKLEQQSYNQNIEKQNLIDQKLSQNCKFKLSSPRKLQLKTIDSTEIKKPIQKVFYLNLRDSHPQKQDKDDKQSLTNLLSQMRTKQLKQCNRMMKNESKLYRYCECCSHSHHESASVSPSPSPKNKNRKTVEYPINRRARYTRTAESGHREGKQICQIQDESKFQSQLDDQMDNSTDNYTKTHPNLSKIHIDPLRLNSARTKKQIINSKKQNNPRQNKGIRMKNMTGLTFKEKMTNCQQLTNLIRNDSSPNKNMLSDPSRRFIISKKIQKSNRNTNMEENNNQQKQFVQIQQSKTTSKIIKHMKSDQRGCSNNHSVQHDQKIANMKKNPKIDHIQTHRRKLTTDVFVNNKEKQSQSPIEGRRAQSSLFQKRQKKLQNGFVRNKEQIMEHKQQFIQPKINKSPINKYLVQQNRDSKRIFSKQQKQFSKENSSVKKASEKQQETGKKETIKQFQFDSNKQKAYAQNHYRIGQTIQSNKQAKHIKQKNSEKQTYTTSIKTQEKKYLINKKQRNEEKLSEIEQTQKEDNSNQAEMKIRSKGKQTEQKLDLLSKNEKDFRSSNISTYISNKNKSKSKLSSIKQQQGRKNSSKKPIFTEIKTKKSLQKNSKEINQQIKDKKTSINVIQQTNKKLINQQNKKKNFSTNQKESNINGFLEQQKIQKLQDSKKVQQNEINEQLQDIKLKKVLQIQKHDKGNSSSNSRKAQVVQNVIELNEKNTENNQKSMKQNKLQTSNNIHIVRSFEQSEQKQKQLKVKQKDNYQQQKKQNLPTKQQPSIPNKNVEINKDKLSSKINPKPIADQYINQKEQEQEQHEKFNSKQNSINFKQNQALLRKQNYYQIAREHQDETLINKQKQDLQKEIQRRAQQKIKPSCINNQGQQAKQLSLCQKQCKKNSQKQHCVDTKSQKQQLKSCQMEKQTSQYIKNQQKQLQVKINSLKQTQNQSIIQKQYSSPQQESNLLQSKIFVQVIDNHKRPQKKEDRQPKQIQQKKLNSQQKNKENEQNKEKSNKNNEAINTIQNAKQSQHQKHPLTGVTKQNNIPIVYHQHRKQQPNEDDIDIDPLANSEEIKAPQQSQNKQLVISFNKACSFSASAFNSSKPSCTISKQSNENKQQQEKQEQNTSPKIIKRNHKTKSTDSQNINKQLLRRQKNKSQLKPQAKKAKFTQSTYIREQIKQSYAKKQEQKQIVAINKQNNISQTESKESVVSLKTHQQKNSVPIVSKEKSEKQADKQQSESQNQNQRQSENTVGILDTVHILTQQSTSSMQPKQKQQKQRKVSIQPSVPSSVNIVFQYVQSQGFFSYNSTPRVSIFDENKHLVPQKKQVTGKQLHKKKSKSSQGSQAVLIGYTDSQMLINHGNDRDDNVIQDTSHFLSESTVREYSKESVCIPIKLQKQEQKSYSKFQQTNFIEQHNEQFIDLNKQNNIREEKVFYQAEQPKQQIQDQIQKKLEPKQMCNIDIGIQCVDKICDFEDSEKKMIIQWNISVGQNKKMIQNYSIKEQKQIENTGRLQKPEQNSKQDKLNKLKQHSFHYLSAEQNQQQNQNVKINNDCIKQEASLINQVKNIEQQMVKNEKDATNQLNKKQNETFSQKDSNEPTIIYNLNTTNEFTKSQQSKLKQKLKFCSNILSVQQKHRKITCQQAYSIVINTSSSMSENAQVTSTCPNYKSKQLIIGGEFQRKYMKKQSFAVNKIKHSQNQSGRTTEYEQNIDQMQKGQQEKENNHKTNKTHRKLQKDSKKLQIQNEQTVKHLTTKTKKIQQTSRSVSEKDKISKQNKKIKPHAQIVQFTKLQSQIHKLQIAKVKSFVTSVPSNDLYKNMGVVIQIMKFFDTDFNNFLNRLFTPLKIAQFWFYNEGFNIYTTSDPNLINDRKQCFNQLFAEIYQNQQKFRDFRNYLKAMTGSPILKLQNSKWSKIKNIKKHQNIYGFAVQQKGGIHRIMGTEQIKENEKVTHLVKIKKDNGKCINMKWDKFINVYKYPFLIAINSQYYVRSAQIRKQRNDNQYYIIDLICPKSSYDKMHCVIGLQDTKILQGGQKSLITVTVYEQIEPNKYKNIGSGDVSFVSMLLKQNNYMLVFEGCQKSTLSICCSQYIELQNGRWAKNMQSAITCQDEELIKYEQL